MPNRTLSSHIILYEIIGFALIILLTWLDELVHLPSLLFGGAYQSNYPEAIMETIIVLCVAIPVIIITQNVLRRLHYLEGFLRVCAWCKKVDHDGHWLTMESYFRQRFNTLTSHGMCPECFAKFTKENESLPVRGSNVAGN